LSEKPIWITGEVYNAMLDSVKYANGNVLSPHMWELRHWRPVNNMAIYCTTYRRSF